MGAQGFIADLRYIHFLFYKGVLLGVERSPRSADRQLLAVRQIRPPAMPQKDQEHVSRLQRHEVRRNHHIDLNRIYRSYKNQYLGTKTMI